MRIRLGLFAIAIGALAACAPAPKGGSATTAEPAKYVKQDFGFNACEGISWSEKRRTVSIESMSTWAAAENAPGFAIHPRGLFGQILTGPFPEDCRSAPQSSWPLYLAE